MVSPSLARDAANLTKPLRVTQKPVHNRSQNVTAYQRGAIQVCSFVAIFANRKPALLCGRGRADATARKLVGWKYIYAVTYDGSGREVSRRLVRKEPIYKEVTEISEVLKRGLSSAINVVNRSSESIYEGVAKTSGFIKGGLISTVEAGKRYREPIYEEVAETSAVIKSGISSTAKAIKRLVRSEPDDEDTAGTVVGRDLGVTAGQSRKTK